MSSFITTIFNSLPIGALFICVGQTLHDQTDAEVHCYYTLMKTSNDLAVVIDNGSEMAINPDASVIQLALDNSAKLKQSE